MKGTLIGGYLLIAILSGMWMWMWGDYEYRGFAYNMGRALVWPASFFQSDPEIDGDSDEAFYESVRKVITKHGDQYGSLMVMKSMGNILLLQVIEDDKTMTGADILKLYKADSSSLNTVMARLYQVDGLFSPEKAVAILREKLDGADYSDIIEEGDDAYDDIADLIEDRS